MTQIEQTPGDRLRFEIILKSLSEGGNNLAILSEHDMVLDFYANLLDERLRALGNSDVEFCFSTNSERLVQKFNEILGELTVDQALAKEAKKPQRRYLVFRDSILMQDFELQLLARLVNGFPASNIGVILLINSAGSNRNKLDAFGKSLLQWEVETRAGEPRKPLGDDWVAPPPVEEAPLPAASALDPKDAQEAQDVAQALTPPNKPSWRIPGFGRKDKAPEAVTDVEPLPVAPAPLVSESSLVAKEPVMTAAAALATPRLSGAAEADLWITPPSGADEEHPEPEAPTFARPKRSFPWGLLLWVPIVTAGVFAYLYLDLIEQEVESFRKYLLRGTPAPVVATAEQPETPKDAASAEPAEPEKETANPAPTEVSEADKPKSEELPTSKVTPVVAASQASTAPASAAVASAPPVAAPAPVPEPVAAAPEPVKAKESMPETKVKAKSDEAWIEQLSANSFVVQLAAFDSEEEMQAFKRGDPIYAKARVLKVRKKDSTKRYFVLIAGPFASKDEAQGYMQSHTLLSKGWLRSAKSLKAQL